MRAATGVVVRTMLVVAVLGGTGACDKGHMVNPGGPSPVSSLQSITIAGTLSLAHPGDTGQLTATVSFSDGTSKDVTGEAVWSPSAPGTPIVVKAGQVTAKEFGTSVITVSYGGKSGSLTARVAPVGAFLIGGKVTDAGHSAQAKVEATSASGVYSTMTDTSGTFVLPGAGAVTLLVSKYGYSDVVEQVTVEQDQQVNVELQERLQTGTVAGVYTLTFIASPSCTLPPEARQRTYLASIEQVDSRYEPSDLDVTLDGASFAFAFGGDAGFTGNVDGNSVRFAITNDLNGYYAFIERVGSQYMHYSGTATGTVGNGSIITTFNGRVALSTTGVGGTTLAECTAPDHRLEFRR
jgi:hypothetical protein